MTTSLCHLKPGERFRFPNDDRVFVVGKADGACVHVTTDDDPPESGPILGWVPVVRLADS